ncbi:wax ester/triacylglycerol synthase family O-acyltransferase [Nocardioides sp. WS12]|uniref:WS/DGAT/MGAT family O-acyltransferase n=1 Tax=Nocardioides sp. WS12 TaxID=2486272 RepID=UPI0015F8A4E9|nr:wax ester/triacylglycerol synthase family O-acyltransferase [Nocardioides sp. WS12]
MKRQAISLNDSGWLRMETVATPMQVGMLATFSKPEDAGPSYLSDLVDRWRAHREFQPPFNYILHGSAIPRWEPLPDDAIDIDYHFRHSALPAPGGERELGILVSRLHSARMDRRYPLWECHVIEGLEGDRWSMYMKVHHSQIDGVGGVRLLRRTFSVDGDQRDMLPPWAIGVRGPDQSGVASAPRPKIPAVAGRARLKSVRAVAGSLTRTYKESFFGTKDELRAAPYRAPKSIFNGKISTPRRFATQQYPIDRLRAVGTAAGGSLNDVFLAICGGAIRRYLQDVDALPAQSLIANVPVSVRTGEGASVGNAITFLYTQLGTDVEDPLERIARIKASTQLGKERLPQVSGAAMDAYTAGLMAPFLGQAMAHIGGRGRPASNLVLSNVPGPAEPRYVDGSRLEEYYPLSLLFHGQALNITAISYAGQFNIGFTGCRDNLPHLQRIAVYAGEALEELEAALDISAASSAG